MSFINTLSEQIILPLADFATGQSIAKHLRFLQKSQWWSEKELRDYQEERLRKLIRHSVETVPYYRVLFEKNSLKIEDIVSIKDLEKIPILTKDTIKREGLDKFTSSAIPQKKRIKASSSGSTGEPLVFYITKEAISFNKAASLRGWSWMGYRLGDKFVKISNTPRSRFKRIQDLLSRNKCLYFNTTDDKSLLNILKEINKFNPSILRSYIAPLSLLLKTSLKYNVPLKNIKAITTTGSVLHPYLRYDVENAFKTNIFDAYSCEGGATVFECHTHDCYHSAMEYAVSEVEYHGNSKIGRLITTDLWNFATPFIRYDSQDLIEISSSKCTCGRNLLPVKKIIGRDYDILLTPDGRYVTPLRIGVFFRTLPKLMQYQVRQESLNDYIVYLKLPDKARDESVQKIRSFWHEMFGENANVRIHFVDEIPLTSSGKRRYVIRSESIPLV